MKRFLVTTAVAALVPMYALAQDEPADGTVLKPEDPAASASQANSAEPMTENSEDTDVAEGEGSLETETEVETETAEGEGSLETETEVETETAEGEGALETETETEAAEGDVIELDAEETEMAEEADPMAEQDPSMADATTTGNTMTEQHTDMAGGSMGGNLGIQGMVPVSAITGGVVYTTTVDSVDENWEGTASYEAVGDGWERIGSIQDIVLSSEGKIEGIVAEVGGFLGIGDKFVMLPTSDFKLVPIDEDSYAVVTPYTTDQLTDMEEYDSTM